MEHRGRRTSQIEKNRPVEFYFKDAFYNYQENVKRNRLPTMQTALGAVMKKMQVSGLESFLAFDLRIEIEGSLFRHCC